MSRFELHLPHRDRADHLSTVGGLARRLDGDDVAIARQVAIRGLLEGRQTVGEEIDYIASLDPNARRVLLDQAREACGLESASSIEQREEFEALQVEVRSRPYVDAEGRRLMSCAAEDCDAIPQDEHGAWRLVPDRRWWCVGHEHLRGEHDRLPPEPRYRLDPATLAAIPVGAAAEREHEQAQRQRERDARKAAERAAEAERRERVRAERRAAAPIPPGFG